MKRDGRTSSSAVCCAASSAEARFTAGEDDNRRFHLKGSERTDAPLASWEYRAIRGLMIPRACCEVDVEHRGVIPVVVGDKKHSRLRMNLAPDVADPPGTLAGNRDDMPRTIRSGFIADLEDTVKSIGVVVLVEKTPASRSTGARLRITVSEDKRLFTKGTS